MEVRCCQESRGENKGCCEGTLRMEEGGDNAVRLWAGL